MWTSWCHMNVKEMINGRKPISILLHSVNILITPQKRFSTVHSSWEHQHYYSNSGERQRPHSQLQGVKSFIHLIQLDPQQPLHGNKHSVQLENTSHPLWKRDRLNLSEKKKRERHRGNPAVWCHLVATLGFSGLGSSESWIKDGASGCRRKGCEVFLS